MEKTWILIANGERARCFERHASDHSLTELTDFVFPRTRLTGEDNKGHGRTGHAGTQFEPHTEAQDKARADFADGLANYLNDAVAAQRCNSLVLIANSPMLGTIKPLLSLAASKALQHSVASDLTQFSGLELKKSIDHALAQPSR
ncbi:host attachment protein [Rhodoferax sp.]|uniref:host attachment protein n=1 Tax=Rhodoferax sp. TaxID=50421 RepID=UPI0025DE593E|nr:host attachment protein [Rhodoferax sp.]MCM2297064.1 host attachment protein [Rhodoferax sp.]MDD3936146.1 host attachment protein [Rhodoferax sp.]